MPLSYHQQPHDHIPAYEMYKEGWEQLSDHFLKWNKKKSSTSLLSSLGLLPMILFTSSRQERQSGRNFKSRLSLEAIQIP